MIKIPVVQTIRFAYEFTFRHIGAIIGLIWIPQLLMSLGGYFMQKPYMDQIAAGAGEASGGGTEILLALGYVIVALFLVAVIGVAVTRQALGLRQGPAVAHFSFGAAELRVVGGTVAIVMLLVLFLLALSVAMLALGQGVKLLHLDATGTSLMQGVVGVLMLGGICAIIYVMVRLSFLFIPASVAEENYGIERSWEKTRGNFWRILAVALACQLPVLLLISALEMAILGPQYFANEFALMTDPTAAARLGAEHMRLYSNGLPLLLGLNFAMAPLVYGLVLSSSVAVYRALTKPATEIIA